MVDIPLIEATTATNKRLKIIIMKYQVLHNMHSDGPKFGTLNDALAYIRHCLRNGNDSMTIAKL